MDGYGKINKSLKAPLTDALLDALRLLAPDVSQNVVLNEGSWGHQNKSTLWSSKSTHAPGSMSPLNMFHGKLLIRDSASAI